MISRQWKAKPYLNYVMKPDEKHAFRKDENQNTTLVFLSPGLLKKLMHLGLVKKKRTERLTLCQE